MAQRRDPHQAGAVLAFTEAFLDGGPVPEPGFQSDEVRVVGGDVGDDEADGPDVISSATEGERELVFRYGPAPAGPWVSTELLDRDLDPAHNRVGPVGPASGGVVTGRDLRVFHPAGVLPGGLRDGRKGPPGGRVSLRRDREKSQPELLTWRVRSWGVIGLAFDAVADGQVGVG